MNWYFNYKDGTNNLRLDPNVNNAKILHNLVLSSACSQDFKNKILLNIINNVFDFIIIIVINV